MNIRDQILALEQSRESLILERDKKIAAIDEEYDLPIKGIENAIQILKKRISELDKSSERVLHQMDAITDALNLFIQGSAHKYTTIHDAIDAVGQPFPEDKGLYAQVLWVLTTAGKAVRKTFVDLQILRQNGGREVNTRNILRRMKDKSQIYSLSLNGSKRYSYIALPDWMEDTKNGKRLKQAFAPTEDNEAINAELLKIENGYEPEITVTNWKVYDEKSP